MLEAQMRQRPDDQADAMKLWFWGETAVGSVVAGSLQKIENNGDERAPFGIARTSSSRTDPLSCSSFFQISFPGRQTVTARWFEVQQPLSVAVIDQFTIRCRTIQLLDEFCRHIVATEGMIRAVEQMLSSHHFVTASERFNVVTDGVDIQLAQVMIDGMPEPGQGIHQW